jgi:hypothetical protein
MKYLNGGDFVTLPWQELVRCRGGGKTRSKSGWVGRWLKVKVKCFFFILKALKTIRI